MTVARAKVWAERKLRREAADHVLADLRRRKSHRAKVLELLKEAGV